MQVTLRVKRFDPEAPEERRAWVQEYRVEVPEDSTVLDSLIHVREYVDETLSLRCSCRGAICGSCAMRVNGHATLACKSKVQRMLGKDGVINVEAMGNQPVIKDLVVDMQLFWDKVRAVQPWLQPQGTEPEAEYVASNEAMQHLVGVMGCIMCGACVSDCTVMEMDKNFLGPAALAKAYRFVADPRDDAVKQRLGLYNQHGGVWDCTRCFECVQVCPKGVAPMDRIMALRDQAIQQGFTGSYGARHAQAFERSVEHSGTLNEMALVVSTYGIFNLPKLLGLLPVGLRAVYKRKMPPLIHRAIPNVKSVRRIFKKVHALEQRPKG
ncbi:MAG: succinate dehydrogenase iron-sulfur subunit [Dehalococcoidia bacterium]|nr:succinate dehydrogenase iron-sulfur subunit [Dehalococcoidia bacterium]